MPRYKAVQLVALALSLSGCVLSDSGLEDAKDGVTTSSITTPLPAPIDQSDQTTVRNAVSSANIRDADTQPMAWANADTGASGLITGIQEHRAGNTICRQFQTSRQRFDGVALYRGETCTKGQGEWTLTQFSEGS